MRYLLLLCVVTTLSIYKYIRYTYKFEIDYFNISLVKPYNICMWNIYHILFNFSLLHALNAKKYKIYYIFVIILNVIWYNIEETLYKTIYRSRFHSPIAKKGDCYDNIFVPELKQDLIFNAVGFVVYYFLIDKNNNHIL